MPEAEESVELRELLKLFPSGGLAKAFRKFDADGNGSLDREELKAALASLPKPKSVKAGKKKSLDEIFDEMDKDGNGVIDLDEWEKAMPVELKASIVESVLAESERGVAPVPPPPVRCKLTQMPEEVGKAIAAGRTPLIVDPSEGGMVDTFIHYGKSPYAESRGANTLDAKRMALMHTIKKAPIEDVLEEFRGPVLDAVVNGKCLCICCSKSVPDFAGKFHGKDTLPLGLFVEAGQALLSNTGEFFRSTDKDAGLTQIGGKFGVVITTCFEPDEFQEHLFPEGKDFGLPKPFAMYQPIIIEEQDTQHTHFVHAAVAA